MRYSSRSCSSRVLFIFPFSSLLCLQLHLPLPHLWSSLPRVLLLPLPLLHPLRPLRRLGYLPRRCHLHHITSLPPQLRSPLPPLPQPQPRPPPQALLLRSLLLPLPCLQHPAQPSPLQRSRSCGLSCAGIPLRCLQRSPEVSAGGLSAARLLQGDAASRGPLALALRPCCSALWFLLCLACFPLGPPSACGSHTEWYLNGRASCQANLGFEFLITSHDNAPLPRIILAARAHWVLQYWCWIMYSRLSFKGYTV